jgi:diguanylate cyclase (GGDEF)-like protein
MPKLSFQAVRRISWRPGPTASRRSSIALGIVLVLVCIIAVAASRGVSSETSKADRSVRASDLYQDAMFDAARQDGQLNQYLKFGNKEIRSQFIVTSGRLTTVLKNIQSRSDGPAIRDLINEQQLYTSTSRQVLASLDIRGSQAGLDEMLRSMQTVLTDIITDLGARAEAQHQGSATQLTAARAHALTLKVGTPIVLGLALLLLFGVWLITRGHRRSVEDQAAHDALTGLPNRLLFATRAGNAIAATGRDGAVPVVMMIDLDRFKEINDTLGHHHGDQLLIQTASRIAGVLRPSDTVARLGGDEFAVLLVDGGYDLGTQVAERIGRVLEPAFSIDGVTVSIEASIGIASNTEARTFSGMADPGERAAELLRHADIAMYDAKGQHSGFAHYVDGTEDASPGRLALLGELREAMNRDELVLHYQPKVAADDGLLLGVEALVRWNHPTRGLLPPSEFIELAEGTTLIQRLTTIVVDKALAFSKQWLDQGLRLPVAVNVSARSLLNVEFPATIAAQLAAAGLPADHLCLELTESTIMTDPNRALQVMQDLRALGVRLSVDDFGTGYSSMAYLKILPVDELKVDRSFVGEMTTSSDDTMLVQSAIDLGHNLGMTVVAEGVEDHQTLVHLQALGADIIQGYYLGRPMAETALAQWINDREKANGSPDDLEPIPTPWRPELPSD